MLLLPLPFFHFSLALTLSVGCCDDGLKVMKEVKKKYEREWHHTTRAKMIMMKYTFFTLPMYVCMSENVGFSMLLLVVAVVRKCFS